MCPVQVKRVAEGAMLGYFLRSGWRPVCWGGGQESCVWGWVSASVADRASKSIAGRIWGIGRQWELHGWVKRHAVSIRVRTSTSWIGRGRSNKATVQGRRSRARRPPTRRAAHDATTWSMPCPLGWVEAHSEDAGDRIDSISH